MLMTKQADFIYLIDTRVTRIQTLIFYLVYQVCVLVALFSHFVHK